MMRLEGNAPAKINLTLEALGRREDGYHEIASVMHTLSLCDTLILHLPDAPALDAAQGQISIGAHQPYPRSVEGETSHHTLPPTPWEGGADATIPADSRNLIWKAVEAFVRNCPHLQHLSHAVGEGSHYLSSHAPCERGTEDEGWRATLIKRVPAQAGLGGGSSDAATTLKLLAAWAAQWGIPLPDLHALAAHLGADVAFFLQGACARARGKGEILEPLPPLPPFWWVIAKPYGVGVPTGWAYAQLKRSALEPDARAPHSERLVDALKRRVIQTPRALAPLLHNDFDEPILNNIPELRDLRQRMEHAGALRVLLCGSGAAQAALCESQPHAESLAHTLTQQGYWAIATQAV
ncbi:MAG: 4-diphosphocytidyl-2-C-methyl-D-erythritol kinase [Fimbriimonadales bacterium]|nr:MAG: 4-diphosphocytidyl-2-C-methyl-D-erythritol kinase [Fimbriimonadales bacterium]